MRHTIIAILRVVTGRSDLYMVHKPPEIFHCQLQVIKQEFLMQLCNTQRHVSVPELLNTKRRNDESVADFITRWGHTFEYSQKFTQQELVCNVP